MEYLAQQKLQATLFVVGSRILEHPKLLQEQYMAGHQIAVHTWSHHYLTSMSNEEVIAELGWSRKIIKDVLGVTPNFMRPPFGDIECVFRAQAYGRVCSRASAATVFATSPWPWGSTPLCGRVSTRQ
jgi:peptidoglycan/xylan/chitin deacetylase (PgdA/CDA1 family)